MKTMWPNGKKLIISVSMQFETGGQPENAEGPLKMDWPKGRVNPAEASWFRYAAKEGIYRMLDLWDRHNIKVTSHVIGKAAEKYPEIAKEIANRGHELAAHGYWWREQVALSYEDETEFVKKGVDVVEKITGQRSVGYNAYWMARSKNTIKILQDLGFIYHIDDMGRDEPSVMNVRGKKFVIVPYTIRNNDIVNMEGSHWSPDQFLTQLKLDFDVLYKEADHKRRMMSFSCHDRIAGTPAMINVIEQFIEYAKSHEGVEFMRKDDIAKMVIDDPNTPVDHDEDEYNN